MAFLGTRNKQPAEVKDYDLNYSEWLAAGDNVQSAAVTVSPSGLVLASTVIADPRVKVWLSGGVNGVTYRVVVTMTSADGRVQQDEFNLKVKEI